MSGQRNLALGVLLVVALAPGCSVLVDGDYTSGASPDAGADAATEDAGAVDAGRADSGLEDAGAADSGLTDAGPTDAGPLDAAPDAGPPDAGPPTIEERCLEEYGETTVLRSPTDFFNSVPRLFGSAGASSDRVVTGNLRWASTTDLFLDSDTISPPDDPECTESSNCIVARVVEGDVPMVVEVTGLDRVVIESGAEFRMRFGMFFFPGTAVARIQFEPPCGTPCPAGQDLCDRDLSCYEAGETFCLDCDVSPAENCACIDTGEGEDCSYIEGDIATFGMCTSGVCERPSS